MSFASFLTGGLCHCGVVRALSAFQVLQSFIECVGCKHFLQVCSLSFQLLHVGIHKAKVFHLEEAQFISFLWVFLSFFFLWIKSENSLSGFRAWRLSPVCFFPLKGRVLNPRDVSCVLRTEVSWLASHLPDL